MTKIIATTVGLWYTWPGIERSHGVGSMDVTPAREPIVATCVVQEVVERYPQTVAVFARHHLSCVGCYISPYHTIADTAREYALALEPLLGDLNRAVGQEGTRHAATG